VVDDALGAAAELRGRARSAAVGDLSGWDAALAQVGRAEDALAQGASDAALRARVAGLRDPVERDRAAAAEKARRVEVDRTLLADLEAARDDVTKGFVFTGPDAGYVPAFRKAGLDLDATDPAAAGRWLAARPAAAELVGYLDDWAIRRLRENRPEAEWRRVVAAARAADLDPWRDALRARVGNSAPAAASELRRLADDDRALDAQPASGLILLARLLRGDYDDRERAARVLRRATLRHPSDFWAHFLMGRIRGDNSGNVMSEYPVPAESERHLTAAVALRPASLQARLALARALRAGGKAEESLAVLRECSRLWAEDPAGRLLRWEVAFGEGKYEEAVAVARADVRREPNAAYHHFRLGQSLAAQGNWTDRGKWAEALPAYLEAARLDPTSAMYRNNVGLAIESLGRVEESIAHFREAARLSPRWAWTRSNLGGTLERLGKWPEALAAYREAVQVDPGSIAGHYGVGRVLRKQGDFAGAIEALRKANDLVKNHPGSGGEIASALAEAERQAALAGRLPALLKGDDRPKDNAERLAIAQHCYDTRHFAPAARFFSEAVAIEPRLVDDRRLQHLYNAACSAALAAAGQGVDEPQPDAAERAALRGRTLGWMKAELDAWSKYLDSGRPEHRAEVLQGVGHWREDSDLVALRGEALGKLPEGERKAWQALWADVDALIAKANASDDLRLKANAAKSSTPGQPGAGAPRPK
jgi:tetratricopeptide (TPR) repeat protein